MLRVRVIGDLTVEADGMTAPLPSSAKVRAVLAWLALHPGMQPRAAVAARLWPDVLDASARASLRSAIWALRRALGDEEGRLLVATRDHVALGAPGDDVWVDLLEYHRLARTGRPEEALALDGGGELLAGIDEEWVYAARDELREQRLATLAAAADAAEARGDLEAAIAYDRRRAQIDPLCEPAHRDLIRRLDAAGDRGAALAAYARLRERMRRELGLSPSPATRAAVDAIRERVDDEPREAAAAGAGDAAAAAGARREAAVAGARGEAAAAGAGDGAAAAAASNGRAAPTAAESDGRRDEPARATIGDRVRALPPLAGREDEREALLSAWARAVSGSGGAAVIEGEGGIGKTRLALELLAHAEQDGAAVAACAALELGGAAPFGLWVELLGDLARSIAPAAPDGDAVWPEDVGRLAPSVARRLHRAAPATSGASPEFERARLFEAVAEMLGWAAGQRPLLLLMEDVHIADVASLELAAYVARRLPELRALLLITRRDAPRRAEADVLREALARRGALLAELELAPLDEPDVAALVRSIAPLSEHEIDRVVAASEGNALLAVEAARAHATGARPQGLRALVRAATARLAPDARAVADLAAVAGRELTRDELLRLPVERPAVAASAALESGLLASRDGGIGFRHALLRAAAYDDLPEPRRADLHEQLAGALEAAGRAPAAELGRHLRLAGRDDAAAEHLVRAGLEARGVGALAEAAAFLSEALEIRPGDPELLLELGEVEAWRNHWDAADDAFEAALAAVAPDDAIGRARALARRGLWFRTSLCAPLRSNAAYREALALIEGRDDAGDLLPEVLAGLAWTEGAAADPDEADALLARVHELTGGRLNDAMAATVNSARGMALVRRGRMREAYGPLVAAADAHVRAGAIDDARVALSNAACAAAFERDFERALVYADRAATLGGGRAVGLAVHVHAAQAYILSRLGRHAEARAAAERQCKRAERAESRTLLATAQHDLGQVTLAAGDYVTAADALGRALDEGAAVPRAQARLARAEALARLGHCDEAEAELRAVTLEPLSASDFPATLVPRLTRVQGLVAAARGDRAAAEALLRDAREGWRRQLSAGARQAYRLDMGRPPVAGLVELDRQLEQIDRDLADLDTVPA